MQIPVAIVESSVGLFDAVAILQDQKPANTQSGTFTSGAWQTRTLNTEVSDIAGIVTLVADQFTLGAGTYKITANAPSFAVDFHQCKIRNITDTADAIIGTSTYSVAANAGAVPSLLEGVVTIAGTKTFELQHQCSSTRASQGFGVETNFGVVCVYATVEIYRFAS